MAKADIIFPITGSLGNLSIFKLKGSDKYVVRTKGGPTKEQVTNDPKFEKVRQNNNEFGGCSRAGAKILRAMLYLKQLGDHNFTGSLTKISRIIQTLDASNPIGKRSILFSRYQDILTGFNLNKENVFDSVVKNSPAYYFSRPELKATLFFPELYPKINILNPWGLGWYRFIIVLGIIPDMVCTPYGYQQANENVLYDPEKFTSEWMPTDMTARERTVNLGLADGAFIDDTGSMVVSVGVEFGRMLTDSIIQEVKGAGCAKVLGVG